MFVLKFSIIKQSCSKVLIQTFNLRIDDGIQSLIKNLRFRLDRNLRFRLDRNLRFRLDRNFK
jgi:hypothetical protein